MPTNLLELGPLALLLALVSSLQNEKACCSQKVLAIHLPHHPHRLS
jgi:hypothetical protein